jgi:aspartate/methionine/tyrosine aminotransferase
MSRREMRSPYMEWAKLHSAARFNLATSGMQNFPLAELPVKLKDLEINGPTAYGYEPLQNSLAKKNKVAPQNVVAAQGTSMANHLAMAAVLDPGDEVLIEQPTYELLVSAAQYLGASIKRFPRRFEDGFAINVAALKKLVSERTRLIVVTNLHNPSGAQIPEATLRELGDLVANVGARVLVDEVYLEAVFDPPQPNAFQLGPQFIVTSSLTKAYGLSGLRCGWVLAEPKLCERMWHINDLYAATPAHPAELLSVIALDHINKVKDRAQATLSANHRALEKFLKEAGEHIEVVRPQHGTVIFPRLKRGNVEQFCGVLRKKYETSVVPGRFFEEPQHFRVGLGGDPAMTAEGLERLARALTEQR